MSTAIRILREAPVYTKNLLSSFCRFDTNYTWNELDGGTNINVTNSPTSESEFSYTGLGGVNIFFTGTSEGFFNNPDGGCAINADRTGRYIASFALRKSQVGMNNTFKVVCYVNSIPTEYTCDLNPINGFDDNNWNVFYFVFNAEFGDTIDFAFKASGNVIAQALSFSRFKVEADDKSLSIPAVYTNPDPTPDVMEYTLRADTSNTQNLSASTDNVFAFPGTIETRDGIILINTSGEITPRKLYRTINVDVTFSAVVPSGTNNHIDIKLMVDGNVYRSETKPFLKSVGATQFFSVSWTIPVGTGFENIGTGTIYPATVKLNPTSNCTISNRFISVVENV